MDAVQQKEAGVGTFQTSIVVGRDRGGPFETVTALVDTGATYSLLPESLLARLDVLPIDRQAFTMADGRRQEYDLGEVVVRIGGAERTCLVIFGPTGRSLLGAMTLQEFGLIADTSHHKLIPVPELTL